MTPAPVTVVVPTYNSGPLVTDAVDSILSQTVPPEMVVVVDDGSTDDTAARLAAYGSRIRYIRQDNQGVSAARNRGLREAKTEFIAFLDADDVWHPRKLEIQLAFLRACPDLGLLGTLRFPWPGSVPELPAAPASDRFEAVPWELLAVRNVLVTSCVLLRRAILEQVGEFDTCLRGPEDHDFWLRIAEVAPTGNLALPLTGYRNVPGSLSKHARRMEEGMLRIIAKAGERGAWRGRTRLRCKARSLVYHQAAYMYGQAGSHMTAIGRSLLSLACYPWPYGPGERKTALERPKWLMRSLLNLLGGSRSADHSR